MNTENSLGVEKISRLVPKIAIPSMLAQFVSVLYSIVDRIFVGNIKEIGDLSLAGVGVCGPILTFISAFSFLIGIGGAPYMGIALGEKNQKKAEQILANSFIMLLITSAIVIATSLLLRGPMLRLFGASERIFPYAEKYFVVYVSGTVFAIVSMGLNQFVIAQGFAKTSMVSVIIGAVLNIILDPIFIFVFNMGVEGAALATIISQFASALFVIIFLCKKSYVKITFKGYSIKLMLKIVALGITPFLIIALDNVMIIAMNGLIQKYGGERGDELITINTIVQSFMLLITMPLGGISGSTQSILSYNYGAGNSQRVIKAQKYIIAFCTLYTTLMFILARVCGQFFVNLFTTDLGIMKGSMDAIKLSTIAIIPLGAQYAIVDGFTGMGQIKLSMPLSFFRKIVYFIALFTLPMFLDITNIFYSETISDIFAILFSFPMYLLFIKKILRKREEYLVEKGFNISGGIALKQMCK